MKVLVACEFSGIVRDAFIAKGHDAWSCDLLPTEKPGPHIQGDVLTILNDGWDMMIAHPPCTYLSYAANHVWNKDGRDLKRWDAACFFMAIAKAPIPKICIENPLGVMQVVWRKPDQIIHPWYFGDNELKRTCLWLIGLPTLNYDISERPLFNLQGKSKPKPKYICQGYKCKGKPIYFSEGMKGPGGRAHNRSRFWPSIAAAMAEQWG